MTLDDAIRRERHAMRQSFGERSAEHRQLAEWLRELRDIKAENAKLRELVHTIWLAGDFRAFLGVGELEVRMRDLGIKVNE